MRIPQRLSVDYYVELASYVVSTPTPFNKHRPLLNADGQIECLYEQDAWMVVDALIGLCHYEYPEDTRRAN